MTQNHGKMWQNSLMKEARKLDNAAAISEILHQSSDDLKGLDFHQFPTFLVL